MGEAKETQGPGPSFPRWARRPEPSASGPQLQKARPASHRQVLGAESSAGPGSQEGGRAAGLRVPLQVAGDPSLKPRHRGAAPPPTEPVRGPGGRQGLPARTSRTQRGGGGTRLPAGYGPMQQHPTILLTPQPPVPVHHAAPVSFPTEGAGCATVTLHPPGALLYPCSQSQRWAHSRCSVNDPGRHRRGQTPARVHQPHPAGPRPLSGGGRGSRRAGVPPPHSSPAPGRTVWAAAPGHLPQIFRVPGSPVPVWGGQGYSWDVSEVRETLVGGDRAADTSLGAFGPEPAPRPRWKVGGLGPTCLRFSGDR